MEGEFLVNSLQRLLLCSGLMWWLPNSSECTEVWKKYFSIRNLGLLFVSDNEKKIPHYAHLKKHSI